MPGGFIVESIGRLHDGTEIISALIICTGVAIATCQLFVFLLTARRRSIREKRQNYQKIRLDLSRFLAMALEFQLAADLLATTVAPSWDQLGRLGAIAVIRTFLNYFLARDIDEEERDDRTSAHPAQAA